MNNRTKFRASLLVLILGISFAACVSNVEEQLDEPTTEDPAVVTMVSFNSVVKPIIDGRCLTCHSSGGNFPELTNYAKISANAGIVKDAVFSGRMPRGGTLTNAQIKNIVDWVDQGALDN